MSVHLRSGGLARVTAFVLDASEAAGTAKRLRYLKTSELDGVSSSTLRAAAAHLRAASYSLKVAARRFEHRADLLDHEGTSDDDL